MSTIDRSLVGRAAGAVCLALCLAVPAAAQTQTPIAAPSQADFFSRYDFHLSAAWLQIDDDRFSWDTHFGGELDIFDYVVGRTSVLIDYEAVLGSQLRAFDPNQGNYTLEASTSARVKGTELALIFHHVSRHLSDREKTSAIAWNVLGARVLRHEEYGGTIVDASVDAGVLPQHANVDYRWAANLDLGVKRRLTMRTAAFVRGSGHLIGVDADAPQKRGTQAGGSAEAGVRIGGREGVLELFAGVERRIDADPLDFQPQQWFQAGFRLLRH